VNRLQKNEPSTLDSRIQASIESLTAMVGQTVIMAPLDWGMGHQTRCLALAKILIAHQKKVVVATTVEFSSFWHNELPESIIEIIPAYQVNYAINQLAWLSVLKQMPRIIRLIEQEGRHAEALAIQHKADSIISDNRFGFYTKKVSNNLYLTHQLFQQVPLIGAMADQIHHHYIRKFEHCLVPDFPFTDDSLAGKLSHGPAKRLPPCLYIGPLSRIQPVATPLSYSTILVSSGPLPLRKHFTQQLFNYALAHDHEKMALITPDAFDSKLPHLTVFNNPDSTTLSALFFGAKHCVSRSGYSTLMDIYQAGISQQTLIPTQGQPEQYYLARYWEQHRGAQVILPAEFSRTY